MTEVNFFHQQEPVESPFLKRPMRYTVAVRPPSKEAVDVAVRELAKGRVISVAVDVGVALILEPRENYSRKFGRNRSREKMRRVMLDVGVASYSATGVVYALHGQGVELGFKLTPGKEKLHLVTAYLNHPGAFVPVNGRHYRRAEL